MPTINFPLPAGIQSPAKGVYASTASWGDKRLCPAVTNIGTRPTVSCGAEIVVETHILGFEGDLYGHRIRLELHKFLRPEARFHTLEDLTRQIKQDILEAQAFHQISDEV
jgi:riboflavin kinase/FMN adenylyltransferase